MMADGVAVTDGGGRPTVKLLAEAAVGWSATSMVIGPEVAPAGTVAVMTVPLPLTDEVAVTPLNLTTGLAPKFAPLMMTDVPIGPISGEKELIRGSVVSPKDVQEMLSMVVWRVVVALPVSLILTVTGPGVFMR